MQYATIVSSQPATCNLPTCNLQPANLPTCNLQLANLQPATCNLQPANCKGRTSRLAARANHVKKP
jgi:uncharacterized protein YjbI with pentapeptide repeats